MSRGFGARESGRMTNRVSAAELDMRDHISTMLQEGQLGDIEVRSTYLNKVAKEATNLQAEMTKSGASKDDIDAKVMEYIENAIEEDDGGGKGFAAGEESKVSNAKIEKALKGISKTPGNDYASELSALEKAGVLKVSDFLNDTKDRQREIIKMIDAGIEDFEKNGPDFDGDNDEEYDAAMKDRQSRIVDALSDILTKGFATDKGPKGFGAKEAKEAKEAGISPSKFAKNYAKAMSTFSKAYLDLGYTREEARMEAKLYINSLNRDELVKLGLRAPETGENN